MASTHHPCALPNVFPLREKASISTAQCLFVHNVAAQLNAEWCSIVALYSKNHSAWKEQYPSTSVSLTYTLEYDLIMPTIVPSGCFLALFIIDCFIQRIFPVGSKVVLWHFLSIAVFSATQHDLHNCPSTLRVAAPLVQPSNDEEAGTYPIRIALQTLLKPHCKFRVLVTTTVSDIDPFESGIHKKNSSNDVRSSRYDRWPTIATIPYPRIQLSSKSDAATQAYGGKVCCMTT